MCTPDVTRNPTENHNQTAFVPTPLAGQYNSGTLENKPGCNAEQTLEALVNGELGRIRDMVGSAMSTRGRKGAPAAPGDQDVL
jgi:hypothetical protein